VKEQGALVLTSDTAVIDTANGRSVTFYRRKHEPGQVLAWEFAPRAGIIEYDRLAPRIWAEALARLDPAQPPGDVPPKSWLRFIDDCGNFLDQGWAHRAAEFGWTSFDLFGCDRSEKAATFRSGGIDAARRAPSLASDAIESLLIVQLDVCARLNGHAYVVSIENVTKDKSRLACVRSIRAALWITSLTSEQTCQVVAWRLTERRLWVIRVDFATSALCPLIPR